MNILVTGSTGFVGHHLIASLISYGHHVRAFSLPAEETNELETMGAVIYRGDIREPVSIDKATEGVDLIFHLAAIHGLWRSKNEYYSVNVQGTENICRSAIQANIQHFVYISSWTVYGMGLGKPVDESFPINPIPDVYTETKAAAEKIVQELILKNSLPAVIIRPGTIFGPGDTVNFGRMADRLHNGKAILIGSGKNFVPFVYVSDVVEGMILAGTQKKAIGHVYNLSTDQPVTQEQLWKLIAQEIHSEPPRIHIPYYPLYILAGVAEKAIRADHPQRQPLITRLGVKLFGSDNQILINKARHDLGYSPKVSIPDGVKLTAKWYNNRQ